jgi:hypothetical protein
MLGFLQVESLFKPYKPQGFQLALSSAFNLGSLALGLGDAPFSFSGDLTSLGDLDLLRRSDLDLDLEGEREPLLLLL